MPDILDASGLKVKNLQEITSDLQTKLKLIYGADINLDQNSPDGQFVGIVAQSCVDIRELIQAAYNSFNPDRAVGRVLDERVPINNISRAGGTFTIQPIDLVITQTLTLQGLDAAFNDVNGTGYTVQDNAGNQFILVDSETLTPGTYSRNFRARQIGKVEVTVNTIVNPVTIVLGVASINNGSAALQVGQPEETDAQLRTRRQQSVALASTGYLNGLLGDILALDGVTDAKLYENYTDSVDVNGIPAHGIWLVTEGGANSDIGQTIYANKSYGANMKGAVAVNIITPSGSLFTALFDRPTAQNLYIRFDIQRTIPLFTFDITSIKQYIEDNLTYKIGQYAETSSVTASAFDAINAQGGGGVPLNAEISTDGVTWVDYLTISTLNNKFTLDTTRITVTVL